MLLINVYEGSSNTFTYINYHFYKLWSNLQHAIAIKPEVIPMERNTRNIHLAVENCIITLPQTINYNKYNLNVLNDLAIVALNELFKNPNRNL